MCELTVEADCINYCITNHLWNNDLFCLIVSRNICKHVVCYGEVRQIDRLCWLSAVFPSRKFYNAQMFVFSIAQPCRVYTRVARWPAGISPAWPVFYC